MGGQAFNIRRAPLRREDTHANFLHGRVGRPEIDEFGDIAAAFNHNARDGAVDRNVMTFNVAEDTYAVLQRGRVGPPLAPFCCSAARVRFILLRMEWLPRDALAVTSRNYRYLAPLRS